MPARLSTIAAALRRLGCTPAEMAALAVLAAASVAAVGLLWILARPLPMPPGRATVPGAAASASPGAGPLGVTDAEVIVHVAGAVARPGVYTMPGGSRVGDAVQEAGGPLRKAVLDGLNLARPLTDGEQVVVPDRTSVNAPAAGGGVAAVPGAGGATPPAATVNLNQATVADLETLPGIGPVTAQAIVDYRDSVGGFKAVSELRDVSGIGEKTFQALAPLVSL